jgi:tRNA A64-2'-O-ribosylphosphate transferase
MPDALSKTIPIWIAVLNRVLFPDDRRSHVLQTPQFVVSESEYLQIEQRLPSFVSELQKLDLPADRLRSRLQNKPMEVIWVTPDSDLAASTPQTCDRNLLMLCTASGRTVSEHHTGFEYVQGAADDSESWACGLTPALFWSHLDQLLSTGEDELPGAIDSLLALSHTNTEIRKPVLIRPTSSIWIANTAAAEALATDFDVVVSCAESPSTILADRMESRYLHLGCGMGKNGSRHLRSALPKLSSVPEKLPGGGKLLVTCPTGRDLAVGVALTLICLHCESHGCLIGSTAPVLTKAIIKHRLSWIMLSMPDASPSRATLQSVNAFLLG